jgi:hypothetical protein
MDFNILVVPYKYHMVYPDIGKVYYTAEVRYDFYSSFNDYFNPLKYGSRFYNRYDSYCLNSYDDIPYDVFVEKKLYHTAFTMHINHMVKLFQRSTLVKPSEIELYETRLIEKYKYYLDGQLYEYNEGLKKYSCKIKAYLSQLRDKKHSRKIYENCGFKTSVCRFPNFYSYMIRYTSRLSSLYLLDFKTIFNILTFLFGEKEICKNLSNSSYGWICDVFLPQHVNYLLKKPDRESDTVNLRFISLKAKQQMRKHKTAKWVILTDV